MWVCTVAGTPGTWTQVGGSSALTYASGALTSGYIGLNGSTYTTFLTTSSLAVGTWLITCNFDLSTGAGTNETRGTTKAIANTGAVTFTIGAVCDFYTYSLNSLQSNWSFTFIAVVTSTATISFQARANATSAPSISNGSFYGGTNSPTYYTATKIA
jgi:hypothetical protein